MGTDPIYTEDQPVPTIQPTSCEVLPYVLHRIKARPDEAVQLKQLLIERVELGTAKHGQPLHTFDGRSTRVDALQEAADLVMYLGKLCLEEHGKTERLFNTSVKLLTRLIGLMDRGRL